MCTRYKGSLKALGLITRAELAKFPEMRPSLKLL